MEPALVGVIGAVLLLIMLGMGVPIAFALGISSFVGFLLLLPLGPALSALWVIPWGFASSHVLSVVALFVLTGHLAFVSGMAASAYDVGYKLVGRLPGGLAAATVYASAAFAATTGSSVAAVGTLGRIAIPEMERLGYDRKLAAGSVAAAGTLGSLIPPSIILVLYGIISGASIGRLLVAGIIPGIISAVIYGLMIVIRCSFNKKIGPPAPAAPWKDAILSLPRMTGVFILFVAMIGGIYLGVFTPTEAGAVGVAVGSLFLVYRFYWPRLMRFLRGRPAMAAGSTLTPESVRAEAALTEIPGTLHGAFYQAIADTTRVVGMLFAILIGASLFSRFVSLSRLPFAFGALVGGLDVPPELMLALLLVIYIPLGMFLEPLSIMVIMVPITLPVIVDLGYHPVWYGIIVVKLLEISLITPPVGLNVYVTKSIAPDIPLEDVFRGIGWFFVMDLITIAVLVAFPEIVLWLPNTMFS